MAWLNYFIIFLLASHFCFTAGSSRLRLHHNLRKLSERSEVNKSGFGSTDEVDPMRFQQPFHPPGHDPHHNYAVHDRGDDTSSKP